MTMQAEIWHGGLAGKKDRLEGGEDHDMQPWHDVS